MNIAGAQDLEMRRLASESEHRIIGGDAAGDPDIALRGENVSKAFGGLQAVNRCSLEVRSLSISGLIGPNGSGKSTLFNIVTGVIPPDSGEVFLRGQKITRLSPHVIVRKGIARTFQITRLFSKMTALENILVAAPRDGHKERARLQAEELLRLLELWYLRDEYAENLSYGQQKLLELGRALIRRPAMMLLDEPFAGINRIMAAKLVDLIRELRSRGTTFFIIDHEMKIIMDLCDEIFVMDSGELIAQGRPEKIQEDPRVLEAYFGR